MSIFTVKKSHQALPSPLPQQVLAARNIINSHQGILIQCELVIFLFQGKSKNKAAQPLTLFPILW